MPDLVLVDHIIIYQGDDRPVVWTLADAAGTPANLTGYTALAQVRDRTGALLHEWTTTDGTAVLNGPTVSLSTADSETWTWSSGQFDLHLTDPAQRTEIVARGSVTVIPAVTRQT